MRSDNAELVHRSWDVFRRDGLDAYERFWHPEITWRAVEGAPDDVGVMEGAAALRRYYEGWNEMFEEIHAHVERVVAEDGQRLVVVLRVSGSGRGSGVPVNGRYAVLYTIRDGKIAAGREYGTAEEALDAAGLRG